MHKRPLARAAVVVAAVTALFTSFAAQSAMADGPGEFHTPSPPSFTSRTITARFDGKSVLLARGWGSAKVCVVNQDTSIDCYGSADDATAAAASRPTPRSASCNYPLRLYEDINYGGRQIWFYGRGFWQNLADFGFDNTTSSFVTGDCYAHLAEYPWGAGYWFPGYTGPWGASSWVGDSWNDRISSIFLE